jgi:flagellar biosynthesis/type III secretory pathway chaperone
VLAQPHADTLEAIAGRKQALLNQVQKPGAGTPATFEDPALRALAARALRLNAANARLLALHRAACESRLQLLRGGQSPNALYRASGYLGA